MRVASFNVGCHDLSYFISKVVADEILASADVIFLQEIEEYHNVQEVKETLSHYGYYNFSPSRSLKKGEHGIAILSKVPITDYEVLELPSFNLLFRSRKRIAVRGCVEIDGQNVQICNVHLDSRLNILDRIKQITPFLELINQDSKKVVLGGDFNTIPLKLYKNVFPFGLHDQSKQFMEFLNEKGFKTFPTQPKYSMKSKGMRWLLDYLYVKNLNITDYGVRANIATSDHHPVWADVHPLS
jgi:endonuclease/exonuclease/phosphatase family metal-dependent hydrolase